MHPELTKHLELLLGSTGIILAMFFAVFLLTSRNAQVKANVFLAIYLLAFSLRIGKSLFHNYFAVPALLRTYFLATLKCVGPSLWLYTRYLMYPEQKVRKVDLLHYLPFIFLLSVAWLIPNDGSMAFAFFYNGLIVHMFIYTLFALWWLSSQYNGYTLKTGITSKYWLQRFLSVNLLIITAYFLISEQVIPYYLGLSFLFSLAIFFFAYWALKNPDLFSPFPQKYGKSGLNPRKAKRLIHQLEVIMENEKPYLQPDVNLAKMSKRLAITTKTLSQLVNQSAGVNFSQFVAQYRVEEAKQRLASPAFQHLSIASIAYDSGFNSISSFNAAFRKHTNTTPQLYRAAAFS